MTDFYEIPISPQNQVVLVSINGVSLRLSLIWNYEAEIWNMDIADSRGNPLARGIPLVPGVNLLSGYEYIGVGAGMMLYGADPTFTNLGNACKVYFVV